MSSVKLGKVHMNNPQKTGKFSISKLGKTIMEVRKGEGKITLFWGDDEI